MPTYEFKCAECGKSFTVVLTIEQHEHRRARCPRCGSRHVQQKVSPVSVVTSRKS